MSVFMLFLLLLVWFAIILGFYTLGKIKEQNRTEAYDNAIQAYVDSWNKNPNAITKLIYGKDKEGEK